MEGRELCQANDEDRSEEPRIGAPAMPTCQHRAEMSAAVDQPHARVNRRSSGRPRGDLSGTDPAAGATHGNITRGVAGGEELSGK